MSTIGTSAVGGSRHVGDIDDVMSFPVPTVDIRNMVLPIGTGQDGETTENTTVLLAEIYRTEKLLRAGLSSLAKNRIECQGEVKLEYMSRWMQVFGHALTERILTHRVKRRVSVGCWLGMKQEVADTRRGYALYLKRLLHAWADVARESQLSKIAWAHAAAAIVHNHYHQ